MFESKIDTTLLYTPAVSLTWLHTLLPRISIERCERDLRYQEVLGLVLQERETEWMVRVRFLGRVPESINRGLVGTWVGDERHVQSYFGGPRLGFQKHRLKSARNRIWLQSSLQRGVPKVTKAKVAEVHRCHWARQTENFLSPLNFGSRDFWDIPYKWRHFYCVDKIITKWFDICYFCMQSAS